MAVNKVTLGDETLIDLTNDTAEAEDVLEGAYFHTAAGVRTAGTRRNVVVDDELSPTSENPVQNKVVTAALENKVDNVTGKGLSTNDYTNAEKAKLEGVETGAQKNPGNATTSTPGLMSAADKEKLDGVAVGANKTVIDATLTQEGQAADAAATGAALAQQKSAIEALEALTNRKAGALIDTASGAIASFVPDSTIDNLLGVSIAVEPVQDLHGYDSPWPGGGGKNKFDVSFYNLGSPWSNVSGVITNAGSPLSSSYVGCGFNGRGRTTLLAGTYTLSLKARLVSGEYTAGTFNALRLHTNGADVKDFQKVLNPQISNVFQSYYGVLTLDESYTFEDVNLQFSTGLSNAVFEIKEIQIELGTAPTAYSPYSNICPISGWSEVGIEATSINAWDEQWLNGYLGNNGAFIADASSICAKNFITVHPGQTMYVVAPSGTSARICAYAADGTYLERISVSNAVLYTVPNNAYKIRFSIYGYGTTYNNNISINYPSTDHAYHAYSGNTYTIALGQTVYGGTLDVTNGTMTVEWACVTESSGAGWTLDSAERAYKVFDIRNHDSNLTPSPYVKTNYLKTISFSDGYSFKRQGVFIGQSSKNVCVHIDGVTDVGVSAFNAYLSEHPLQICYALATPITIQLDPVTISAISGQTNNVWSDAGDVSVTYAADIKSYIDRLNQPTEDDMIANTLIAANKYFTVNNRLFLSTASIAAGAQIIPGTNCTETSLVEALNALNA